MEAVDGAGVEQGGVARGDGLVGGLVCEVRLFRGTKVAMTMAMAKVAMAKVAMAVQVRYDL